MNINVTLSHRRQMPVFVFGSNPNLRQCDIHHVLLFSQNNTQSEIRKPRGKGEGRTLAVCLTRLSGYQSNLQFFG